MHWFSISFELSNAVGIRRWKTCPKEWTEKVWMRGTGNLVWAHLGGRDDNWGVWVKTQQVKGGIGSNKTINRGTNDRDSHLKRRFSWCKMSEERVLPSASLPDLLLTTLTKRVTTATKIELPIWFIYNNQILSDMQPAPLIFICTGCTFHHETVTVLCSWNESVNEMESQQNATQHQHCWASPLG